MNGFSELGDLEIIDIAVGFLFLCIVEANI